MTNLLNCPRKPAAAAFRSACDMRSQSMTYAPANGPGWRRRRMAGRLASGRKTDMSQTLRGADIVARSLKRLGCHARVHAVRQPHHVDLRRGARRRPRSRPRPPRGRRRPHGRRPRPADRRGRHCARHRRARPRQCRRRAVHRARRGIADGAVVRPRRDLGAWPRRLPGASPGRHGERR